MWIQLADRNDSRNRVGKLGQFCWWSSTEFHIHLNNEIVPLDPSSKLADLMHKACRMTAGDPETGLTQKTMNRVWVWKPHLRGRVIEPAFNLDGPGWAIPEGSPDYSKIESFGIF